jgi:small subunit ribosomal protein S21
MIVFGIVVGPFCIAHFLVVAGKCVVRSDHKFLQVDWFSRCGGTCRTTHKIDELNVAYNTKAGDSYCSLSPVCPSPLYMGKHWLVPKSCLKDGGVPKSPCAYNWQQRCPSAGTLSNFDVGSYRWCPCHPSCAYQCASGPGALAIGSIYARSKRNTACRFSSATNNIDQALKVLKRKMQREGVFREMKLRGHYEKSSERRVREKAEAIRRARKFARKKLQREGLLPMKPRANPRGSWKRRPAARASPTEIGILAINISA